MLDWLGVRVPDSVKGQPIELDAGRDAGALESRADRLRVVLPRRLPALWTLLAAGSSLLLAATLVADRRGMRWALRVGALAVLWVPAVVLVTAALEPSRTAELLLVAALRARARRAHRPRSSAGRAGRRSRRSSAVAAYIVDLALGSPLIIRSLLGPNPLFGSRFYGIGNELEATLPALLLIGARRAALRARALARARVCGVRRRRRRARGRDRRGAARRRRRRRHHRRRRRGGRGAADAARRPDAARASRSRSSRRSLALAALAAIDLLTGGDSHFTRTVLRADDSGALWDVVTRRYELAGRAARARLHAGGDADRAARDRLRAALSRRGCSLRSAATPAMTAALGGAIAVGVAGALFNDSGPVLLLFATFVAACVVLYVRGDPRLAGGVPASRTSRSCERCPRPKPRSMRGSASARPDPAPTAR